MRTAKDVPRATLAVIPRGDGLQRKVLLGLKLTGAIGIGTYNGCGGKVEGTESAAACLVRESYEELGIEVFMHSLTHLAALTCIADTCGPYMIVDVFSVGRFRGEPRETHDMRPEWFSCHEMPYDRMLEADRHFWPRLLAGEQFRANLYYRKPKALGFKGITFFPY